MDQYIVYCLLGMAEAEDQKVFLWPQWERCFFLFDAILSPFVKTSFIFGFWVAIAALAIARDKGSFEVPSWRMLAFPCGRMIVIPGHIAVRAMTLFAIAAGRWKWFWLAFAFFTLTDSIAAYLGITGMDKTLSPWIVQLWPIGFAIASIPLILHVCRHWPLKTVLARNAGLLDATK